MSGQTRAQDEGESTLWQQQFDSRFDFPPTPATTKYVICSSPRSGSHFLGHLLHRAGGFGYPLEYVNDANLAVWAERARGAGAPDPLAYVKSIRTDRNGAFGIKVHYNQLNTFLTHEPDVLSYRFITLERRDVVRQAISYSVAAQTKVWISGMAPQDEPAYDWEAISTKLAEITRSNAGWRAFLTGLGVEACDLVYEDVRADPAGAVRQVAAFLELDLPHAQTSQAFMPTQQSDPRKDSWQRRFVEETRDRLERGELLGEHSRREGARRRIATFLPGRLGEKLRNR